MHAGWRAGLNGLYLVGVLMRAASTMKVFSLRRIGVLFGAALFALSCLSATPSRAEPLNFGEELRGTHTHRALLCGPIDSPDIGSWLPSFEYTQATPTRSISPTDLFMKVLGAYESNGIEIDPDLVIEEGEFANAFVRDNDEVVVTTRLIDDVQDQSELAFILAHELAHIALGHEHGSGVQGEIKADELALHVVASLGLNPCAGAQVLDRLSAPLSASLVSVTPRLNALLESAPPHCG